MLCYEDAGSRYMVQSVCVASGALICTLPALMNPNRPYMVSCPSAYSQLPFKQNMYTYIQLFRVQQRRPHA